MGFCKRFVKGKGEVSIALPNVVHRYNNDKMNRLGAANNTKEMVVPIFVYLLGC